MSKKNRRRTPPRPTVVFDFGGVLSAGHDPVPDVHELLGGDIETLRQALWAERPAYDAGACTAAEYWGAVAAAVGIQQLSETEVSEVQEADNRYFLRLEDRKSTRLNSSHVAISYAVFCLKKKTLKTQTQTRSIV